MPRTLLLDGYNLIFRSYYAIRELTRSDGFPTNAIHGWMRTLWYLEDQQKPDRMIAFFDLGGSQRHLDLQADYKANRADTPDDLIPQIPVIKELTVCMGVGVIEQEGVEADDLLGSAAVRLGAAGEEVVVVSADKDLGQLVGGTVKQLLPAPTANPKIGWRLIDEAGVTEKFGIGPERIPDYLALVGDTSDNIRGVDGVGPKTAAKWLQTYGTLEKILQNCGQIKPVRFQQKVHDEADRIRQNLELTTLRTDYAFELPEQLEADSGRLQEILSEMEMKRAATDAVQRYGGD